MKTKTKKKSNENQLWLEFTEAYDAIDKGYARLREVAEALQKQGRLSEEAAAFVADAQTREAANRVAINKLVRWIAFREARAKEETEPDFKPVWGRAYDALARATGFHPALARREKETLLDATERHGHFVTLLAIVRQMFANGVDAKNA
jgi:hypothetical protein